MVQIVAAPQLVATCAGQISGTPVTPTFATTAKPISTPIPIASKPINSSIQSGVVIPAPGKPGRAASMSSISMQPAAILPNPQTANVGTIVLQPGSQYGSMTLLNASGLSATQSPKVQAGNTSVHTTMNSQGFMTTLRNIAPPQSSSQAQKVKNTCLSLLLLFSMVLCIVCEGLSLCLCLYPHLSLPLPLSLSLSLSPSFSV